MIVQIRGANLVQGSRTHTYQRVEIKNNAFYAPTEHEKMINILFLKLTLILYK